MLHTLNYFNSSLFSQKTGRILSEVGKVLIGNSKGIATPSNNLIDLEIDVKTIFNQMLLDKAFLDEIRHLNNKLVKVQNGKFVEATLTNGHVWLGNTLNKPIEAPISDVGLADILAKYVVIDKAGLDPSDIPNAFSLKSIAPLFGSSILKINSSGIPETATSGVDYVNNIQLDAVIAEMTLGFATVETQITTLETYIAALAGFNALSDLAAFLGGVGISNTAKSYADYIKGLSLSIKNTWKSTDLNDEGHIATGDFQMFEHGYSASNRGQGGAIFFDSRGRSPYWGDDIYNPNNSESGIRVISWDSGGDEIGTADSPLAPVYMGVFGYRNTQNLGFVEQRTQRGIILRAEFHQTDEKGDYTFRYPMVYGMYDVDRDLSTRDYGGLTNTLRYGWSYKKALWEYRPLDDNPLWEFKVPLKLMDTDSDNGRSPVVVDYLNYRINTINDTINQKYNDSIDYTNQKHGDSIYYTDSKYNDSIDYTNNKINLLDDTLSKVITDGDILTLSNANAYTQDKVDKLNISISTKLDNINGDVHGPYDNLKLSNNITRNTDCNVKLLGDVKFNFELNGLTNGSITLSRIAKTTIDPETKITTYYTGFGDSYNIAGVDNQPKLEFNYKRQDGVKRIFFEHLSEEKGQVEKNPLNFVNPITVLEPTKDGNPVTLKHYNLGLIETTLQIDNLGDALTKTNFNLDKLKAQTISSNLKIEYNIDEKITNLKTLSITNDNIILNKSRDYTDLKVKNIIPCKNDTDLTNIKFLSVVNDNIILNKSKNYTDLKVKNIIPSKNEIDLTSIKTLSLANDNVVLNKSKNYTDLNVKNIVLNNDVNLLNTKTFSVVNDSIILNKSKDYTDLKLKNIEIHSYPLGEIKTGDNTVLELSNKNIIINTSILSGQINKTILNLENEFNNKHSLLSDNLDELTLRVDNLEIGGGSGDFEKILKILNHEDAEVDYHPDSLMSEINLTTDLVRVLLKDGKPRVIFQGNDVELKLEHKDYTGFSIQAKKDTQDLRFSYKNYNGVDEELMLLNKTNSLYIPRGDVGTVNFNNTAITNRIFVQELANQVRNEVLNEIQTVRNELLTDLTKLIKNNYIVVGLKTGTTQNTGRLNMNHHIVFDLVCYERQDNPPGIVLDATTAYTTALNTNSIGRILLRANKTYKITTCMSIYAGPTQENFNPQWYNVDAGIVLNRDGTYWKGNSSLFAIQTMNNTMQYQQSNDIIITKMPNVDTRVELRIMNGGNLSGWTNSFICGCNNSMAQTYAIIEQLD